MQDQTSPAESSHLTDSTRRLHRALLLSLVSAGQPPAPADLARATGMAPADVAAGLRGLVAADYAAVDAAGRLTCLYPFSPVPTPHLIALDGQPRYAMCAIDALGFPAMLDRELTVAGSCAACSAPIRLDLRPGAVIAATPPPAMVVARRDEAGPAVTACCPFTVFACGPAHANDLATRIPGSAALPLEEALRLGETLFGDLLLAAKLPARRRRWGSLASHQATAHQS